MDNNHQLDAPDNDSLNTIEQVSDHSELASLYPSAHNEWEGTNLLSQEVREAKRDKEQLDIVLSVRKSFALIGLLTPLPLILGALLVTAAYTYLKPHDMVVLLLPVVIAIITWLVISYKSWKKLSAIFYQHSITATPFVITLLLMLMASLPVLYLSIDQIYSDSLVMNTLMSGGVILATSIAYSGILVLIWTAQKLSGAYKIGLIGIIVGLIGLSTMFVNML